MVFHVIRCVYDICHVLIAVLIKYQIGLIPISDSHKENDLLDGRNIEDISVEDPPLEEVIAEVFAAGEQEQDNESPRVAVSEAGA